MAAAKIQMAAASVCANPDKRVEFQGGSRGSLACAVAKTWRSNQKENSGFDGSQTRN